MKHLFVPYEIALKLKELGFDEPCLYTVFLEDDVRPVYNGHQTEWVDWNNFIPTTNPSVGKCYTSAPLYQQVMDWFLKEHGIWLNVYPNANQWEWEISFLDDREETLAYQENSKQEFRGDRYEMYNMAIEEALKLIP